MATIGSINDRDLLVVAVGTGARWGGLTAFSPSVFDLAGTPTTVDIQRAWKATAAASSRSRVWDVGTSPVRRPAPADVASESAQRPLGRCGDSARGSTVRDALHQWRGRSPRAAGLSRRSLATRSRPCPAQRPDQEPPRSRPPAHPRGLAGLGQRTYFRGAEAPGHESIQTTVDVYGGLLDHSGDAAHEAIEAAMKDLDFGAE